MFLRRPVGAVALVSGRKAIALGIVGLAHAGGVASASSRADAVTLSLRQYTNDNKVKVLVWYGQVASSAAGDDVEVLGRECLTDGYRQLAATRTLPGGGWEVESLSYDVFPPAYVEVHSGTTFRARWRDQLSTTISYRVPLSNIYTLELERNTWTVKVNPTPHNMKLTGRVIVLQRRAQKTWVTYKRARLAYKPTLDYGGATNYQAIFKVTAPGLQLRAYLPAKGAAPCYLAGASKPWRS
jgi:hypothetical protein